MTLTVICFVRNGSQLRPGDGRGILWFEDRDEQNVEDEQTDQDHTRQDGAHEKVTDGNPDDIADEHQDDTRRYDLTQGPGSRHRAGGQLLLIAAPQHGRHRQQAHGDHRGADNSRRCTEQGADHNDGYGQPAAQTAEQKTHGVEQFLGQAGALQHDAHENEQGNGDQGDVGHHAPDPQGQQVEERPTEADQAEHQGGPHQGEGDREAGHQHNRQRQEHPCREVCHQAPSSLTDSIPRS